MKILINSTYSEEFKVIQINIADNDYSDMVKKYNVSVVGITLSNEQKNYADKYFSHPNVNIQLKDYYFSNVIARSSKTMLDCFNSKLNIKRTGTEG